MSDTTPNNGRNESDGRPNPETDATTPADGTDAEQINAGQVDAGQINAEPINYDSPAAREPENFTGTGSHSAVPALADDYAAPRDEIRPEPVVAPVVVPAAPVSEPVTERVHEPVAEPVAPAASTTQSPIYVQAPQRPVDRTNRGVGVLIALLATGVFAVIYAIVIFIIAGVTSETLAVAATTFTEFAIRPVFYIPVLFFFLAFALLVVILNRSGWWAYVLFGFLVGVVVYLSYIGGALLTVEAWTLTPAEASRFLATQWLNPGALAAGIIAREVPIWAGAWIARRGKRVTARNIEARHEYEHLLAEGPQLSK